MIEDLEDVLIRADLGVATAATVAAAVGEGRYDKTVSADEVKAILAAEVEKILAPVAQPLVIEAAAKPFVILVVGVNGSGKTTTIGKLAARLSPRAARRARRPATPSAPPPSSSSRSGASAPAAPVDRRPAGRGCGRPRLRGAVRSARASRASTCCSSTPPAACRTRPG